MGWGGVGWCGVGNEAWKLKTGYVLSQIRFKEWLQRWELKIRKLAASSNTSSKLFNILGIVTLLKILLSLHIKSSQVLSG